jgi:Na+/H+ antiporter NhaC
MKEGFKGRISFVIIFIFIAGFLHAAEPTASDINAREWGIWTLIPPLTAIILAFVTRNVILSLFIGIYSGAYMLLLNTDNAFHAIWKGFIRVTYEMQASLASSWNAGIILQTLAIGGLIGVISRIGGAKAIAEALSKKAKSPRSAQFYTWCMGLFIFFDDYANALTVGPIMRPVTDRMKISREKLAFIIDATAAPIAGIALISTWIGYELGLINDGFTSIGLEANAYGMFIRTIPYRFYNIFILIFILVGIWLLREFGPMYKAEKRARKTGNVHGENAQPMVDTDARSVQPKKGIKLQASNAVVPILILILGAFLGFYYDGYRAIITGTDSTLAEQLLSAPLSFFAFREAFSASNASIVLFQAALLAGIVAIAMGVKRKIFGWIDAINAWVSGAKALVITIVILILAWSLSGIVNELGTAIYLVSVLSDAVPAFLLSSIIFILGASISFATGTSYGTMGILMPLAIPLAYALDPSQGFLAMNIGAVLTGAIFGDHCSPISDTTILSSMGSACDHIDHTRTQLGYAVPVALIAIFFGYIPTGLGVPVWITLIIGAGAVFAVVRIFGKKV